MFYYEILIILPGIMIQKGDIAMIGIDLLILAVAVSVAVTLVGFVAKAIDILRNDRRRSEMSTKQTRLISQ